LNREQIITGVLLLGVFILRGVILLQGHRRRREPRYYYDYMNPKTGKRYRLTMFPFRKSRRSK
jgi:hypothetical protein